MEVKVMFGRHIWDYAQMADALGKRTFELRRHEHYTLPPGPAYGEILKDAAAAISTADRISSLYQGILPGLIARYHLYVGETDKILDEPTIVIVERSIRELERQRAEASELSTEFKFTSDVGMRLAVRERAIGSMLAETVS
jgi:hypothetical protein